MIFISIIIFLILLYFLVSFSSWKMIMNFKKNGTLSKLVSMMGGLNNAENLKNWATLTGYNRFEKFYKIRGIGDNINLTEISLKDVVDLWMDNAIYQELKIEGCLKFSNENIYIQLFDVYKGTKHEKDVCDFFRNTKNNIKNNVNYIVATRKSKNSFTPIKS